MEKGVKNDQRKAKGKVRLYLKTTRKLVIVKESSPSAAIMSDLNGLAAAAVPFQC